MTEQQLALNLIQAELVTPQQVRTVAERRPAGVGIAQALVDAGIVSKSQIVGVVPNAFALNAPNATAPNATAPNATAPNATAPNVSATNGAREAGERESAEVAIVASREQLAEHRVLDIKTDHSSFDHIGLGTGSGPSFDESGVVFEGEHGSDEFGDAVMGTIVTYCNELLKIAVNLRSSDMHLEPREHGLLPRYRVDGHLRSGGIIPKELQASITSRFKVLANLDITENRMPQDGRFRATIGGHIFDFRVSTLPSIYGEKVVMRLLDRSSLVTDLTKLGFTTVQEDRFAEMLGRSYGMILVTGPTGSGKTTTLYAALASARDETKNVITVEDPVEYELEGVTQTNVQPDIELTFAAQLRAILRQDPDVILVGEIRDGETAEVAIRAALTGHLVLSTLHTNSAVGAVTRLQDMGVAPFLIASSLAGALAQRLVRLICRGCKQRVLESEPEYQDALLRLRLPEGTPMFKGVGCEMCGGTGYKGRLAIIELLNIDSDIRRAIMQKSDADTLRRISVENGHVSLWEDGLDKLRNGLTTSEELSRVLLGVQDED